MHGAHPQRYIKPCPTCNLVSPLIEQAHLQSGCQLLMIGQTAEGNEVLAQNHSLTVPLLDDSTMKVSFAYELDSVPHVFLTSDDGQRVDDIVGFDRKEWRRFFDRHLESVTVDWDEYPEWRPGCGSLTQDPIVAEKLRAVSENSSLRARKIDIAEHDDVHEFMFDQGITDGLPIVPPTPERVLRMFSGTARDPQKVVATIRPNLAPTTVEKIAINAVLAGCKPDYLPVVLSTIEAICTDEFNCHGGIRHDDGSNSRDDHQRSDSSRSGYEYEDVSSGTRITCQRKHRQSCQVGCEEYRRRSTGWY